MTDDEIKTKRLTDWKPETDIKLQKAFGKFVEEAGELLEEANKLITCCFESYSPVKFENELADCLAFIEVIGKVVEFTYANEDLSHFEELHQTAALMPSHEQKVSSVSSISMWAGLSLSIVGRCQIQGLSKSNPETGKPNKKTLQESLEILRYTILINLLMLGLNKDRIEARKQAKIDSKLPWVMGTATDLIPDS